MELMANNPTDVRALALAVLDRMRDSTWDSAGTVGQKLSHGRLSAGTAKTEPAQAVNLTVPVSHALGTGTVGQSLKTGTPPGTVVGQAIEGPFGKVYAALASKCPDLIPEDRWRQCVADAQTFLAQWGEQAHALGWTSRDLFGLHTIPTNPHPSYSRLSRYDATGLIWLLQGQTVVALTATTAAIRNPVTGNTLIYRRFNKPGLGPIGDSLDDFTA
jgi:hypothetical protein